MKPPATVNVALCIYFLTILLGIVGAIPNYLQASPRPSIVTTVLVWIAMYGLLVGIGYAISLGKNWARHLNAVISLVSAASVLMLGTSKLLVTDISQVIMLVNTVASILVVILLYSKSSNDWFRSPNHAEQLHSKEQ